ncbi:MAG: hypothetical protein L6V84_01035 [Oscillospiraceae bacterium]|nr:MAG: hypothetical protein L6V84_01035 [Oscillospiraceae bacterium]
MTVLRVDDLAAAIVGLRRSGRRVYAAALDADAVRLGTFAFGAEDCVVIGNEGHGLSPAVIDACDRSVYIPMQGRYGIAQRLGGGGTAHVGAPQGQAGGLSGRESRSTLSGVFLICTTS